MSTNIAADAAPCPSARAIPAWDVEYSNCLDIPLTADPAHVATARQQVTYHLRRWDLDHLAEDAALITSELVTNAVLYGRTERIMLRLAKYGSPAPQLLITVTDESAADAVPKADSPEGSQERGRGLHILQCLASCWGTAKTSGGKLVWATLALYGSGHENRAGRAQSPCCAGSELALALARSDG
ncbi:ATP-binding protein [Streptomyces luteolifulvus]|jgi:anti-sigma regulatory factor (Ser/Thr protein kinase)|uniref:ATP-binding protein n=1 Tax=Streptomyces luteolifulvus TaxID=2615112 RepID=A0A6H9US78_9ACTN|nr:ATP-binding protein [Streptomyces luteolifulvus]